MQPVKVISWTKIRNHKCSGTGAELEKIIFHAALVTSLSVDSSKYFRFASVSKWMKTPLVPFTDQRSMYEILG